MTPEERAAEVVIPSAVGRASIVVGMIRAIREAEADARRAALLEAANEAKSRDQGINEDWMWSEFAEWLRRRAEGKP